MTHASRGLAVEQVFVNAWKDVGFIFNRNQRSDRMKKMSAAYNANPDLVADLEPIMHVAVEHACDLGHEEIAEAPLGFMLTSPSPDIKDVHLRLHLNNEWVRHPRPSPDSKPMAWFGSTGSARWHTNTHSLWGGEFGGLLQKARSAGHKTWTSLRRDDKDAANKLIEIMRDALYEEGAVLTSEGISNFINYLGLGANTLHLSLDTQKGKVKSDTYGDHPSPEEAVTIHRTGHDRLTLACGQWRFDLRTHNADSKLSATSFKVEVEVPEHP